MKTLIIYDIYPEETIKAVVDLTQEQFDHYSQANGHYINGTNDEVAMDISNEISELLISDWEEYKIEEFSQDLLGAEKMITTGIFV
jgi:hypothetical protein